MTCAVAQISGWKTHPQWLEGTMNLTSLTTVFRTLRTRASSAKDALAYR